MRNPLNLQQNDAEFVEATRERRARMSRISRLSAERPWAIVSLVTLGLLVALSPAFGPPDASSLAVPTLMFAAIVGYLVYLDLQIKFLKALDGEIKKASEIQI